MDPKYEAVPPQPPIPPYLPPGPPQPKKSWFQSLGAGAAAIVVAIVKFKALLLGGLKTGLSMIFMIWIYSMAFGWKFAAGFVFLMLVHEMGHVVAAKMLGLPVSAPLFIPFLGAAIVMKENPRDAWTEALMAYGGPLAGCIGSWICWGIALQLDERWIMAVASLSFLINLFNMIPIPPLDGGRICAAVSPWFWILGLIVLGLAVFYFHAFNSIFIIVLVLIVALPRIKEALFSPATPDMQEYYNTHISKRLIMALLFLALLAALLIGYWDASSRLTDLWDQAGGDSGN